MSDLPDFLFKNSKFFTGPSPIIDIVGVGKDARFYLSREFYLYLAANSVRFANILGSTVEWMSPKNEMRYGIVNVTSSDLSTTCACPERNHCKYKYSANIGVKVLKYTGSELHKASLCLWHENRKKYPFKLFLSFDNYSTEDLLLGKLLLLKPHMDTFLLEPKQTTLDPKDKKDIYEKNKFSETCVACGKPTVEKPVFISTIRYCPCID